MRICICIGCDEYLYASSLKCAFLDARRIFDLLTDESFGAYDKELSVLLASPSLFDIRTTLERILYSENKVADFTLFFAGHAAVMHDSLYLAVKDTRVGSIAVSGFSFSDLAKIVVAAKPIQANFILDACNSGGLGVDLTSILRHNLTGTAETTSVSALAAAGSNETANENIYGGYFTSELIKVMKGDQFVQSHKPFLDLPEIGSIISVDNTNNPQTISSWALNLQGPNRFSRNPNFIGDLNLHPDMKVEALGRKLLVEADDISLIKRFMIDIKSQINEFEISSFLEKITFQRTADDAALLLAGVAEGFQREVKASSDPFAEGRILGIFSGQLLRHSDDSNIAMQYISEMINHAMRADLAAFRSIRQEFDKDHYCLLDRHSLSDLYFLPIRISEILGRLGWIISNDDIIESDVLFLKKLTDDILSFYANSVLAISEEQAAALCTFLYGCFCQDWIDTAEIILGSLFFDITNNGGLSAKHQLEKDDIISFLQNRSSSMSKFDPEIHAQPSDLLSVIIIWSAFFRIDEGVDEYLIQLDHAPLNIFIPNDPNKFGLTGPISGRNIVLNIGNGVWKCCDIRREVRYRITSISNSKFFHSELNRKALLLSALSLRDRIPWFVLEELVQMSENQDKVSFNFL